MRSARKSNGYKRLPPIPTYVHTISTLNGTVYITLPLVKSCPPLKG